MLVRRAARVLAGRRDWRPSRFWYVVGWLWWGFVFKLLLPLRTHGAEHIPPQGAVILASNHVSGLDPFALAWAIVPRWPFFLAKEDLFRVPVLAYLIAQWGAIPIDRSAADVGSARAALQVLRAGGVLAIFPEGTRSLTSELQPFVAGTVNLALKRRVPIVPAAIAGTEKVLPKGARLPRLRPVNVAFGPPLRLWEILPDDSEASRQEGTRLLHERVRELLVVARG